jgi:hypothetical protein
MNRHMLCLIFERDDEILDIERQVNRSFKNIHVRFIRIFSKHFRNYAALKDNPNIIMEDDS